MKANRIIDIGGKAKKLYVLQDLGFNVPPFHVFSHSMLKQILEAENVENHPSFSSILKEALESNFGNDLNSCNYAVRSSAAMEDGANHSFAGLFKTMLNVPAKNLPSAIAEVWQSANSERVSEYCKLKGISSAQEVSVIVQEMIHAEKSGVAFSSNPIVGEEESCVISSVYGLGEGLVSGDLEADVVTVSKSGIEKQIATKRLMYVSNLQEGGIKKVAVRSEMRKEAVLSSSEIEEIIKALVQLEHHFNEPQDVEFAFCKGELYLLQTRPITAIHNKEYILWDNSNIIESYPGVTTPLTYSFISKMYDMVYRQFVALLGVPQKKIQEHSSVFENTLGLVRGRVYYNLLNWYKMLAMLPGFSINAEFMENMMGVKERFQLDEKFQMKKLEAKFRIAFMLMKMMFLQITLPLARKRFQNLLHSTILKFKSVDLHNYSASQLLSYYKTLENNLLLKWKAPLTNDFFSMIWFGVLQKLVQKNFPKQENLHNDLLCGSNDIISVQPIHRTIELARYVYENTAYAQLFMKNDCLFIWKELQKEEYSPLRKKVDSFIHDFGERCVGELKLETVSYTQEPAKFIAVVKSYVEQGITTQLTLANHEEIIRGNAEKIVQEVFAKHPFRKRVFSFILKKARDHVSNRENLRFERTRAFGMVREIMNHLGDRFNKEGLLESSSDIFYLQLNEILEYENIHLMGSTWKMLVESRKAEFNEYAKQPVPQERFFTYGYEFSDEYIYSSEKLEPAQSELKGIGCCPGVVTGRVRKVTSPSEIDSLNGDILVTSSTDPGWVTLFPSASAILVERGSLLSHSAIVSRELGIPCIVGVKGLLRSLNTGDRIRMNGSTGQIHKLEM